MKIVLFISFFFTSAVFAKKFSFVKYISNDSYTYQFPRNQYYRYRGQETELFSLQDALHSFWNPIEDYVASPLFSGIKLSLMGVFFSSSSNDEKGMIRLKKSLCKNWDDENDKYDPISLDNCFQFKTKYIKGKVSFVEAINKIIKENGGEYFAESKSIKIAKDLIDLYFLALSDEEIRNNFLDYIKSRGHYPSELVFSSIYPQASYRYGNSIIVFKDEEIGIDLNYYNHLAGHYWGVGGDAGEYINPGYVSTKKIVGYEIHKRGDFPDRLRNDVKYRIYAQQAGYPIEFAFYKYLYDSKDYVLVYDSIKDDKTKSFCMRWDKGVLYHCLPAKNNYLWRDKIRLRGDQELGVTTKEEVFLVAVVELCQEKKVCAKGKEIFNIFNKTKSKNLNIELKNKGGLGESNILEIITNFTLDKDGVKYKTVIHYPDKR